MVCFSFRVVHKITVCVTTGDIFYLMVPSRCVWGSLHHMPQLWQHELLWARNGRACWVSDSGVQDTGLREGTKGEPGSDTRSPASSWLLPCSQQPPVSFRDKEKEIRYKSDGRSTVDHWGVLDRACPRCALFGDSVQPCICLCACSSWQSTPWMG